MLKITRIGRKFSFFQADRKDLFFRGSAGLSPVWRPVGTGLSACGFRGLCPQVCDKLRVCYLPGICLPTSGPGHKRRSYSPRGELCGACAGLPQAGGSPGGHQPPSPAPSQRRCCRLQLQAEGHAPPGAGLLPYSAGVVPVGGLLGEGRSAEQHHQHQEASIPPSVWWGRGPRTGSWPFPAMP